MKILFLTNNLNTVNGITTFLYQQSKILIQNYDHEIYIMYSEGNDEEKFKKLGVKLFNRKFFSFEKRSFANFLFAIIYCTIIIIKFRISIINPQIHYAAAYSFYPSKFFNKTYIQTVHDVFTNTNRLKLFYGKKFLTINESYKSFIKKNISGSKIKLIRCPYESEEKKILKTGKIKIISSGRLVKGKSFEVFLNAIYLLDDYIKNKAEFYIAGDGDYSDSLINLARQLNVIVKFLGPIQDIDFIYEKMHVFVMSTGNFNEGLGLGIIQAALKGNLIITPSYPAINELLTNERDGFIFKMGDSKELSKILEKAIDNYDRVKILADNFNLKIKKEFSYEKNGKILNEVYCSLA